MIATLGAAPEAGARALRIASIVAVLALVGAVSVVMPLLAIGLALAVCMALRGEKLVEDGIVLLLAGTIILNYGFANVGVNLGPLPLPLTEVVLFALVGWCLVQPKWLHGLGLPGLLLAAVLLLATLRLIVDMPRYSTLAVRDYTTPLEAMVLLVGFWAFNRFGLKWCERLWLLLALAALAYGLLYPIREAIVAASPVVGLQQAVPLLGQYQGVGAIISAGFFLFLLRFKAPWSFLLGAACLLIVALFQARGLYLVLPLTAVVITFAAGRLKTSLPQRLAGTIFAGVLLMLVVMPLAPSGRMGPVTASFTTQQLGTLIGRKGPGDGSYEDRIGWIRLSWERQTASVTNLIAGVGLGPDLANGAAAGPELTRKPHNDYIEIINRYGLAGAILWAGLFASLLLPIWRAATSRTHSERERAFLVWVIAGSFVYMFIAATQPLLAFPYGTIPLFMLLGMGLAQARRGTSPEAEAADE
ncbi:MAG TPA: hypothetical protein VI759_01080 [Dehalococcoidia bacterium]|nr:hypothetical protein [Dehalococcoidia bacterium]